jgi:RNA polymerase sigma-70 factor, ECF subfamily
MNVAAASRSAHQRQPRSGTDEQPSAIQRLSPSLFSYFMRPQAHPGDAEDLLQECWLRIHRSRHTYRATGPLLPWIFAIARHTMLDDRRRRHRRASREVFVAQLEEQVDQRAAATPPISEVSGLLEQLTPTDRDLLLLLKVTGMSMKEAARATSSSVAATKQRAHRAYKRLRALLAKGSEST